MMWHRHAWKVVREREQPSKIETLAASGITRFKQGYGVGIDDLARKDVIVFYHCDECGADKVERV